MEGLTPLFAFFAIFCIMLGLMFRFGVKQETSAFVLNIYSSIFSTVTAVIEFLQHNIARAGIFGFLAIFTIIILANDAEKLKSKE